MQCRICETNYASRKSFSKHFRLKHDASFKLPNAKSYTCFHCEADFSTKIAIEKHMKSQHEDIITCKKRIFQRKIVCSDSDCKQSFISYGHYVSHLRISHGLEIEEEHLTFNSKTEFEQWKDTEIHGAAYIKESGIRTLKTKKVEYLKCHRSYTPHITSGKRTKYCGSAKIGSACPSNIRVLYAQNKILVHFVKTHFGHSCDVGYVPLPLSEKKKIADKLASGVSFDGVLDDIQASAHPEDPNFRLERIHLVNKKDLYNISKQFNIDTNIQKSTSDAVSVEITLQEICESVNEDLFNDDHIFPSDSGDSNIDTHDYTMEFRAKCEEIGALIEGKSFIGEMSIPINHCFDELINLLKKLPDDDKFPKPIPQISVETVGALIEPKSTVVDENVKFFHESSDLDESPKSLRNLQKLLNPRHKITKQNYFSAKNKKPKKSKTIPRISNTHSNNILASLSVDSQESRNFNDMSLNVLKNLNAEHSYVQI